MVGVVAWEVGWVMVVARSDQEQALPTNCTWLRIAEAGKGKMFDTDFPLNLLELLAFLLGFPSP